MTNLPKQIKPKELTRIIEKLGFRFVRQSGSHAIYHHQDGRRTTIPLHPSSTLGPGLLHKIITKDLELSIEDFVKLLRT